MKSIYKNQNGFTIIELLIALVIFTVGILGVATMQTTSIKGNSKGRLISEASNVAADRIERILSLPYNDPSLADTDGDGTDQADDESNYGLDDLENPDGSADSNGDGTDDIFWNIAVDHPLKNTKTIKIFVKPRGAGDFIEMTYIKTDLI